VEATGIGKDFFSRTPEAQQLRERMDKLDYMKLKSYYMGESRWQIADGPWNLDLHDFKQLLQIFVTASTG
jgi:hypothetical protein